MLQIGNGASRGSVGSGPITNSTGMVINRTGTLNLNNHLTGSGGFTNNLNATVNLWGTNTMSGPILIQVGMLSLSNAMSQGSSTDITLDASTGASANSRLAFTGGIDLPAGATITMIGHRRVAGPSRCTLQNTAADIATNYVSGPILIGSGDGLIQLSGLSTTTGLLQVNGNISNHPDNATPFSGSFYLRGAGKGTLNGSVNLPAGKAHPNRRWHLYGGIHRQPIFWNADRGRHAAPGHRQRPSEQRAVLDGTGRRCSLRFST